MTIDIITHPEAVRIIATSSPLGLYILKDGEQWVAIDNSTGDAWTEEFKSKQEAIDYLKRNENE